MYELVEIVDNDATRFIKLKDVESGVIEECFDDSAVVSSDNFKFMEIGKKYDCKIKLFGKPVSEKTNGSVICKLTKINLVIGRVLMVEVQVHNNKYYIPQVKVHEYLDCDNFNFSFTRKDLVQVNTVIHADLL